MKKIILSITIFLFSFVITGCFTEETTIEFVSTPKSVYTVTELKDLDLDVFYASVKLRVSGVGVFSLLVDERPAGLIVSGLEGIISKEEGDYTLIIKYNSATIYWSYKVIEGDIPSDKVKPTYDWYGDGTETVFEIKNENDLYGFANIVNGIAVDDVGNAIPRDNFKGKVVKLTADINLTDKVWTPIGEGARKSLKWVYTFTAGTTLADIKTFVDDQIIDENGTYHNPDHDFTLDSYFIMYEEDGGYSYGRYHEKLDNQNYILLSKDGNLLNSGPNTNYVIYKNPDNNNLYELYSVLDYLDPDVPVFMGTFDGQNHTIKGLSDIGYNPRGASNYYVSVRGLTLGYTFGLFGRVSGDVTLKNVKFTDVAIIGSYIEIGEDTTTIKNYEIDSASALVGYYGGVEEADVIQHGNLTIQNCEVSSGSISGYDAIGGLIGRGYHLNNLTIIDCKNYADITAIGKAGGIGGFMKGYKNTDNTTTSTIELQNLINYGEVTVSIKGTSGGTCGGILTRFEDYYNAIVKNCINYGEIETTTTEPDNAGGIFYHPYRDSGTNRTVENNFNYGKIKTLQGYIDNPQNHGVPTPTE